jgi:magnesium chelatase accessory protein
LIASIDWPQWEVEGHDWPHRETSRFVEAVGLRWHVQVTGPARAPALLLLHGTGAASHSWRHVMPLLHDSYRLVVPDLPGHGFTRPLGACDLSLPGMVGALSTLLQTLGIEPRGVVGHSAGAAIAVRWAASAYAGKHGDSGHFVACVNGAFLPIRGSSLLSPMAKALFANPLSASMFALLTRHTPLGGNLLLSTGSRVDREGADLYRRLMACPGHVRGALGMMASWDLDGFEKTVARLCVPLTLIASRDDPMVPCANSREMAAVAKSADLILSPDGGHLVHESEPRRVSDWLRTAADAVLAAAGGLS